jgi:hypothetical protein
MRTLFQRNITEHVATRDQHTTYPWAVQLFWESISIRYQSFTPCRRQSSRIPLSSANYSRVLHSEDGFTASEIPNFSKFAENPFISGRSASARLNLIGYVWKVSSLLSCYCNTSSERCVSIILFRWTDVDLTCPKLRRLAIQHDYHGRLSFGRRLSPKGGLTTFVE